MSRGALAIRCEPTDLAAALTNPLCIRDHPLFSPFLSFLSFFPSFFSDRPYLAYLTVSVFADSSTRCLLCFPISRLLATPTEKDSQPTRINNFVAPLISVLAFHSVYRNLVNLRDDFCDRFLIPIGRKVFCTDAQRNLAKTLWSRTERMYSELLSASCLVFCWWKLNKHTIEIIGNKWKQYK